MPDLQILTPDGNSRIVPLDTERITIGRSSASDLSFPEDNGLSRQHLSIERTDEGWALSDLASKNGTILNGNRVSVKTPLKAGDRIMAGHLILVYDGNTVRQTKPVVIFDPNQDNEGEEQTSSSTVITNLEGAIRTDRGDAAGVAAAQISALVRAGNELSGHRPLPELFRFILDLAIGAVKADRGVLLTIEDGELVVRANKGEGFRISSMVRDRVLTSGASVLVRDTSIDDAFRERRSIVEQNIRTLDAYQSPVLLLGGVVRKVRSEIMNGRFALSAEALEAAWTPRVKVLILNTPWNPVGSVLTADELRAVAEFCERRNVWLIGDEIYEAITYGGAKHLSAPAVVPSLKDRYIHVNSLSKTYAMPGWRVGYCAGPAAMIDRMFMVLAQSSRGPATFIQDAAAEALSGPQTCVDDMRTEYTARRAKVLAALDGIPGVAALAPEGGFFAMADIRALGQSSNDVRRRLLQEQGLVVVHGAAYGEGGEGTLRVSFASGGEVLDRGLEALRRGLA